MAGDPHAPSTKVLLTVELAEQVLSYLPFQDLIQAERVCRTWASIISWSSLVRQGLFLEPSAHALSMAYQSNTKLRKPWQWRSLTVKRYTETYTIALLNPYLISKPEIEVRGTLAFTFNFRKALALPPTTGRWRNMFATQPPCRNVKIHCYVGKPLGTLTGMDRISDPAGVRLGPIVDRVRDWLVHLPDRGNLRSPFDKITDIAEPHEIERGVWIEGVDCFVEGFISEEAAVGLASKAAEVAAERERRDAEVVERTRLAGVAIGMR